jgi:branched-chain amino acid transport system permease protein
MRSWRLQLWLYLIPTVGFALLPLTPWGTSDILNLGVSLFIIAGLASSWNILAGLVGRVNLGHVAFFGLGSLITRQLWLANEWPFVAAFGAGSLVAALAAILIGIPALRLKGIYFSVATLALSEALRLTVSTNLPRISRLPGPMLREYDIVPRYYLSFAVLVLIVVVIFWLRRSKLGLGMVAVREDAEAARSVGVNVLWHSLAAFVLSAFLAGLLGGTFAYFHLSYYPSFTFGPIWTFDALLVTFIGGIGTIAGPLIGAVFFVLLRDVLASSLVNIHLIIFGLIFIVVVLILPGGIVQIADRWRWRRWFAQRSKRVMPEQNRVT